MLFEKGTEVFTADGEKIGTISRIVIDARTRDVTDVVVERGIFSQEEKVIPVGLVDLENQDRLVLRETNQNVDDFLDYETTHYVPVEHAGAPYENVEANYWYPPVNFQMQVPRAGLVSEVVPDQVPQTETSIPEGRIAITEGAQVVSADDFSRFGKLGVIAEVQPFHLSDDMRWMEQRIGAQRCEGAYAFKRLAENGALLCFGFDWPGTSASEYPINPLLALYAATTRQTLEGKPPEGWFPEERVSLETALRAYTTVNAWAEAAEGRKGVVKAGALADLAVWDADPFQSPLPSLRDRRILMTILGGRIVRDAR